VPEGTASLVRPFERLRFVAFFGANGAGLLLGRRPDLGKHFRAGLDVEPSCPDAHEPAFGATKGSAAFRHRRNGSGSIDHQSGA
jgi:hypothetical protein